MPYVRRGTFTPLSAQEAQTIPESDMEWVDPSRVESDLRTRMGQPGYTPNWNDVISLADNTMNHKGEGYSDYVDIPGLGSVHVTRGNGPENDTRWGQTGVSSIQLHNQEADNNEEGYKGRGWGWQLSPDDNGGIARTRYDYSSSGFPLGALAVLAAPFAVAGLQGAGLLGGAAEAAPAWTSGFDLAGGAALPTGSAPAWTSGFDLAGGAALPTGAAESAPAWTSGFDLAEGGLTESPWVSGYDLPQGGSSMFDKAAKFIGKQSMKELVKKILIPTPQGGAARGAAGPGASGGLGSYIKPPTGFGALQQVQQAQIPIMNHAYGNTNLVKPTMDWEDFQ